MLAHIHGGELPIPEGLAGQASLPIIVLFHMSQISVTIMPMVPKQSSEEVLQTEVMEDNNTLMAAADLPYSTMRQGIVADMIDTHVARLISAQGHVFGLVIPHRRISLQNWVPFGLVRPQNNLGPLCQSGKQPIVYSAIPVLAGGNGENQFNFMIAAS